MLLDPLGRAGREHLKLLLLKLGRQIQTWPTRIKAALQVALLISISVLWRKLFVFFEPYLWALAPAFDETRTMEDRLVTLTKFVGVYWCC